MMDNLKNKLEAYNKQSECVEDNTETANVCICDCNECFDYICCCDNCCDCCG